MAGRAPAPVPAPGAAEAGLAADLRGQLRLWCQDQGLLGELRAFLRHRLVTLTGCGGPSAPAPALALLAADLLRHLQLWFSLAVVTAEAGLKRSGPQTRLSAAEVDRVLKELGVATGGSMFERYAASDQPLLMLLLQCAEPTCPPPTRCNAEQAPQQTCLTGETEGAEPGSLELRMLRYRRRANDRVQEEYARQLASFKADQLKQVKEQEKSRYRRQLAAMREELEQTYQERLELERQKLDAERDSMLVRLSEERTFLRESKDRLETSYKQMANSGTKADLSLASQCNCSTQTVSDGHCDRASQTDLTEVLRDTHASPPKRTKLNVTFDAVDDEPIENTTALSSGALAHSRDELTSSPVRVNRSDPRLVSGRSQIPSHGHYATDQPHPFASGDVRSPQSVRATSAQQSPAVRVPSAASQLLAVSGDHSPSQPTGAIGSRSTLCPPQGIVSATSRYETVQSRLISDLERRVAECEANLSTSHSGSQFSSPDRAARNQAVATRLRHPCCEGEGSVQKDVMLGRQRLLLESLTERASELEEQMRALQLLVGRTQLAGHTKSERPLATNPHPSPFLSLHPPHVEQVPLAASSAEQQKDIDALIASTRSRLGEMSAAAGRLSRQFRDSETARQRAELDRLLDNVKPQLLLERKPVSQSPERLADRQAGVLTGGESQLERYRRTRPDAAHAAPLPRDKRIDDVLQSSRMTVANDANREQTRYHAFTESETMGLRTSEFGVKSVPALSGAVAERLRSGSHGRVFPLRFSLERDRAYEGSPTRDVPVRHAASASAISERSVPPARRVESVMVPEKETPTDVSRSRRPVAQDTRTSSPSRSRLFSLLSDRDAVAVSRTTEAEPESISVRDRQKGHNRSVALPSEQMHQRHYVEQDNVHSGLMGKVVLPLRDQQESKNSLAQGVHVPQSETKDVEKLGARASCETAGHPTVMEKEGAISNEGSKVQTAGASESLPGNVEEPVLPKLPGSNPTSDLDPQQKSNNRVDMQEESDQASHDQWKPVVDLDAQWKSSVDLDSQWKTGTASRTSGEVSGETVAKRVSELPEPSTTEKQKHYSTASVVEPPPAAIASSALDEDRVSSWRRSPAESSVKSVERRDHPESPGKPSLSPKQEPPESAHLNFLLSGTAETDQPGGAVDEAGSAPAGSPASDGRPSSGVDRHPQLPGWDSAGEVSSPERPSAGGLVLAGSEAGALHRSPPFSDGSPERVNPSSPHQQAEERRPMSAERPPASPVASPERSVSETDISGATGGGTEEDDFW